MTRQESLFAILPRAIADAVKSKVEIAVINAPIHVDEHAEGEHVYAPKVAIEGGLIYRKFPNLKWEIDAVVSPDGSVFYTHQCDALGQVERVVKLQGSNKRRIRDTIYCYPAENCTRVHDIGEDGDIIAGETRSFEDPEQALRYAQDRVPVGEAFVVVNPHDLVATFGSKVALRNGGWI